ncbi:hypothetical protein BE221DRAFT_73676 [Ostreococcus tauri]|uniref:Uncharacterized protein n=1 Tax=Ostreococcus tauri TaxID=70448 RepID=A0A1Y5II59_OSTTA|nr:hypothetical protein BE221DRAFT_73676 [Ostreococcus tauri]
MRRSGNKIALAIRVDVRASNVSRSHGIDGAWSGRSAPSRGPRAAHTARGGRVDIVASRCRVSIDVAFYLASRWT